MDKKKWLFGINTFFIATLLIYLISRLSTGYILWSFRRQFLSLIFSVLGFSLELLSGVFNMAFSAEIAMAACIGALGLSFGLPPMIPLFFMFMVLILSGIVKAVLISKIRVYPMVITIALNMLITGIGMVLLGGEDQISFTSFRLYESSATWNIIVALFVLLMLIQYFIFSRTYYGRYIRMLGENESVLRQSGMNVLGIRMIINTAVSLCYFISAVIYMGISSSGSMRSGVGLNYKVMGAAFLSGIGLNTGRGNVLFCLFGAASIVAIDMLGTVMGLNDYSKNLLMGMIIILCCMGDLTKNRK